MLSLTDILQMKKEIQSRFGAELHYHDVCPKPYFTLETKRKDIEVFVTEFLKEKGHCPNFSEDGLQFTAERIRNA